MKIDKALSHFDYKLVERDSKGKALKLKKNFTPTENDIKAFNAILQYKETMERQVVMENESFAKLYIHQLMLLNTSYLYPAERSIQVIDEILDKSVYEWCLALKEQIPMMRFNSIGLSKYPIGDIHNVTKQQERNKKILEEFETELTEALKYTISEDSIIKFVNEQITRVINKYEKSI